MREAIWQLCGEIISGNDCRNGGNWDVYGEADLRGTHPRWQLISALFPGGECATRCPETPWPTGQVRRGTNEWVRALGTPPAREISGREGGLSPAAHPTSLGAWAKYGCPDLSGEGSRGTGVLRSQNWPCERTWGTTMREATTAVLTGGERKLEAPARQVIHREALEQPCDGKGIDSASGH